MNVNAKLNYLGFESKESKKTGKAYLLVKLMEQEGAQVFNFYVSAEQLKLVTLVGQLYPFEEVGAVLKISSYNGEAKVDLEKIVRLVKEENNMKNSQEVVDILNKK